MDHSDCGTQTTRCDYPDNLCRDRRITYRRRIHAGRTAPSIWAGSDLRDIRDTPAAEYSPEPVRQKEGLVATRDLQVRSDLVVHLAVRTESHANLSADWNTKNQAADFHSHRARCTGLHNYRPLT